MGARTQIHQPTIKEIAYIGEKSLFIGCEILRFSKESLQEQDKIRLADKTNFDIIMTMMRDKSHPESLQNSLYALQVLSLLFPTKQISYTPACIRLTEEGKEDAIIDNENYEEFKKILTGVFCLKEKESEDSYNPVNKKAQEIAEKLKKGKKKIQELKNGDSQKISILSRYVSILSVGEQKDMNELLNYTVFQLYDEFERFGLKMSYDTYIQARMAGAKDLKEVDNWMKDIHEKSTYN